MNKVKAGKSRLFPCRSKRGGKLCKSLKLFLKYWSKVLSSKYDKVTEQVYPKRRLYGEKRTKQGSEKIFKEVNFMRINNNLMALNTQRYLSINNANTSKSIEKLSSGYRINRAGDDAAGMAISEKMKAQIRGLEMAAKNSQDAISLIQTAEGALTETHAILQRMNELAVQSASDTNQDNVDREALQQEFAELKKEINDIASKTTFNGRALLDGTFGGISVKNDNIGIVTVNNDQGVLAVGDYTVAVTLGTDTATISISDSSGTELASVDYNWDTTPADGDITVIDFSGDGLNVSIDLGTKTIKELTAGTATITVNATPTFQTGSLAGDELALTIGDMSTKGLAIADADISTREGATAAITSVNNAINLVSTERAKLGAYQNRLEHKINSLNISAENLQAAESRIRDVDMAKEMMIFTKNNILTQAATAMLAQANQTPQTVLQLLR
jgi:flagellin